MNIFSVLKFIFFMAMFTVSSAWAQDTNSWPSHEKPIVSLCRPAEKVIFTCWIRSKVVSICARQESAEKGGAIYRFGRRRHIELEATDLHQALIGWVAGGETQIYADTPNHKYIVYYRMIRLRVDEQNHNIPSMTRGLVVLNKAKITSRQLCTGPFGKRPGFDPQLADLLVPPGPYIDH